MLAKSVQTKLDILAFAIIQSSYFALHTIMSITCVLVLLKLKLVDHFKFT